MNTKQLQYVLVLARTLNFSHGAQEMNITQPAFSKQIIALENELGVKLFDRETNPLSLTPAGEFFVKKARNIVLEQESLVKAMEKYKSGECGKLTIGVAPFRSLFVMPKVVAAVKERFPDVHISLQEYGLSQLQKGLKDSLYDFAIMNLPVDEAVFDVIPLEPDSLVLAVPHKLLKNAGFSAKETVDLAECGNLPFAVVGQNQELRKLFDRLCSKARFEPQIFVEVTGVTTLREMVKAGLAAAVLPKEFVMPEAERDGVSVFELKQDKQIRQPAIVTLRGQYISEYAEFAIDFLVGGKE